MHIMTARTPATILATALLLTACVGDPTGDLRAEPPAATASPTDGGAGGSPSAAPTTPAPASSPSPSPPSPSPDPAALRVGVEVVGEGFNAPVHVFAHDDRTFVVEQSGRVKELGTQEVWLDLSDRIRVGGEQGLLDVDVHPTAGHWVAHWSAPDDATTLATYLVDEDGRPDPTTEEQVLRVAQPARNHNGGSALFGPDGRFWLSLGDGGGAGDRFGNGQDPTTLLGALLRLDLDDPTVARVPGDNPFVGGETADGQQAAPEIWAWGLRNPYRIAFGDDQVYIADVGQRDVEEVTILRLDQAGANLGWPLVEGDRCFKGRECDLAAFEPADVSYTHESVGGCSVIGGHVYEGAALPALRDHFLYADFCAGILRTVRGDDGAVADEFDLTEQVGNLGQVTGIGADADGEALITTSDGRVLRLVPA